MKNEMLDPVERYYRLKNEKNRKSVFSAVFGYKSPLLDRFESDFKDFSKYQNFNYSYAKIKNNVVSYGTYVEKTNNCFEALEDIEVIKLLRIKEGKLVTAIKKVNISKNMESKFTLQDFTVDNFFIHPNYALIDHKAIHSYSTAYFNKSNIYLDNFIAQAFIPKGSIIIKGIDAYTHEVSYISEKLYIPEIKIIGIDRNLNKFNFIVEQNNKKQLVRVY